MVRNRLNVLAAGAALSLGIVSEAAAGCCPALGPNCACGPVLVQVLVPAPEIYVVNQGPVFSGPGPGIRQIPDGPPADYPYVGFVYNRLSLRPVR